MTEIVLDGVSVRMGEPIQVTESVGYGWYPTIAQFPTGELLLIHSLVPDKNDNVIDVAGFIVSCDDGESWGDRYDILSEHQPMIFVPQDDGALMAIPAYLYADSPGEQHSFHGPYTRFEAGGQRVVIEPRGVRIVDWPWAVTTRSNPNREANQRVGWCFDGDALVIEGRLIATMYGTAQADDEFASTVVSVSEDSGRTWRYLATVAGPESVPTSGPQGHGPSEPSMVQLANGDLMCVMRMGGGAEFNLRRSYSSDGGRTWSAPDVIPPYSVEPSLKRLQNDTIVLSTGRPGIHLWLSKGNQAKSWQSIDILAHHNRWAPDDTYGITPEQTTAYTELIEVSPNKLLLTYDRTPFGWEPTPIGSPERNRIFILPIEVER